MNRAEKQQAIDSLNETFRSIQSAFLIDFRGVKVVEATELRQKIREMDGSYVVVKNTLATLAAKQTDFEKLEEHFRGPTAVAYHRKDIVGLAKVLYEISKSNPNFQFKAALVEGKVIPASEIQALASMPPREVLLSKLAFLLKAPLQKLGMVLKAPLRDLNLVLKQIQK
ncbi:MAG: 50S ribosomal protein L10 [Acidobacteria bacterium]|nr:50S ribosomal protein L10 [Acidobacteriota bacterium]